jgi:hypothetical protein
MMVIQQSQQMDATGVTGFGIGQHHHMADGQRCAHGFGRSRVYLVV